MKINVINQVEKNDVSHKNLTTQLLKSKITKKEFVEKYSDELKINFSTVNVYKKKLENFDLYETFNKEYKNKIATSFNKYENFTSGKDISGSKYIRHKFQYETVFNGLFGMILNNGKLENQNEILNSIKVLDLVNLYDFVFFKKTFDTNNLPKNLKMFYGRKIMDLQKTFNK